MTEHEEPQQQDPVASAFSALDHEVGEGLDVEASLVGLHRRIRRGGAVRGRVVPLLAAAAAVALVVAGVVVLRPGGNEVAAVDLPLTITPSTDSGCLVVVANVQPAATPDQIAGIESAVRDLDGVVSFAYVSVDDTYAEFRRLFEDQPDFVESIEPSELPSSFAITVQPSWGSEQRAALESLPGVYRVEEPRPRGCDLGREREEAAPSGGSTASQEGSTTTVAMTSWRDRPADLSGRVQSVVVATRPRCASGDPCMPEFSPRVLGTVIVDGVEIKVPETAELRGCGAGDAMEPISFDELARRFAETESVNALASVWWTGGGGAADPQPMSAESLSFGSCG